MDKQQKDMLEHKLLNCLEKCINIAESDDDIIEVARIASCISVNLYQYVFNGYSTPYDWIKWIDNFCEYKFSKDLKNGHNLFIATTPVRVVFYDDFEHHVVECNDYLEAVIFLYMFITNDHDSQLPLNFYFQWFIEEGRKHAGFLYT